jgi:hypothetical protein
MIAKEDKMIDSIQGFSSMQGMSTFSQAKALTDEQKTQISDILSNYDKDNLTAEDAKEIFESFREAGIQPGPGMKEAIDDAGFDADELRDLAKPSDMPPGPPPSSGAFGSSSSKSIDASTLQSLQEILNQYDLSSLTSDQEEELLSKLSDSGLMKNGSMIDLSV